MTERLLENSGADYRVLDAADNADAIRELGFTSVPVVVPDNDDAAAFSGFRDDQLRAAIDKQQHHTGQQSLVDRVGLTRPPQLDRVQQTSTDTFNSVAQQPEQLDQQQQQSF